MASSASAIFHAHQHDILFHTIFGSDREAIAEFVHASAVRLYHIVKCQFLVRMMDKIIINRHGNRLDASLDMLKALFFLFLNVDMVLKEYVCNTGSKVAFAAAMNVAMAPNNKQQCLEAQQQLEKLHAWSMVGTKPLNAAKARGFFKVLHDRVAKSWLQDERLTPTDLVKMVKDEYLVA
jgi:hypothetical protein